ncbi:type VI secretion system ATPase TssH [Haemophilus parainfluenzae]|jgi:type VI secretion ATPase, clpV1 family|uniref:Type VI secretion system ATPase TssH n=1 Tax=Haemophilus parainfluenzae ATCC 33392 TaxID=888828 RepID=A0ABD7ZGH6_HAEPA|nr:type VI secretion system ATPase TssH [Haemophilus parainfluenzae]EGC71334.1 type VI secretion ATPase, ClpV1 family [Haemophilus parainfluenzae ATCC 33392]EIF41136.1 type VI secretion ATPase, ClpV1 family [Haemophilus parainfluenzae HK262]OBX70548.1 ClpV1 family T6SS ATPase [Haemophilus parainfluenzae]OBX72572.1 ClpV1 family T6SS ATPase [Haemophilus parainfluenzae]QQB22325.1 type VI secretion system ATPase TssH [Haemophilus parainfluenzae]
MIKINLAATLGALNDVSKLMLEESAAYAISCGESEVLPAHLLLKSLENPFSDVRFILNKLNISHEELTALLLSKTQTSHTNIDSVPSFSPLLIEMLQEAWLLGSLEFEQTQIRSASIFLALVLNASRYLPTAVASYLNQINKETLRQSLLVFAKGSAESQTTQENTATPSAVHTDQSDLARFAENLTAKASAGNIDPVLARDKEIDLMIDILSRRRKNNPIVVGDAGVGKSALIEGLALRIVNKQVPPHLQNVELWSLDLAALQSGASIKGEFEKRLKSVIDFVKNSTTPIVLFIDEAHTLIGAGGSEGGNDAANLLKPALARGELRTIAATTWSEYKKYVERDPALSRRFQLVKVDEPSIEESIVILRGLKPLYEKAHGVYITGEALETVTKLSARYIAAKKLPDKAIDILDTACARVSTAKDTPPKRLSYLDNKIHEINVAIAEFDRDYQLGETVDSTVKTKLENQLTELAEEKNVLSSRFESQKALVEEILSLRTKLSDSETEYTEEERQELIAQLQAKKAEYEAIKPEECLIHAEVGSKQITAVIADLTGIPVNSMTGDELTKLTELPDILNDNIKGQSQAIEQIHKNLLTAMADLRRAGTPLGALLLVGPSGVGKTETAIQIAEHIFGGKQFLTTINMSEYQEKHTVSRLIGSPPGYVGYGEGGLLTEAIRQKPYSIVLLDEVEKAHPDVLNLFYQAFDKGELADGEGRLIDCKNILFMLTSNCGFDAANDQFAVKSDEELRRSLLTFFKPALLARMQIVQYHYLTTDVMQRIVKAKLAKLEKLIAERYKATVTIAENILKHIEQQCEADTNGARLVDAILEGQLLPPLSLALLQRIARGEKMSNITINFEEGEYQVDIA